MKAKRPSLPGQPAPRLQQHWDWRAAANFICGGSGGALVLFAGFAGLTGVEVRPQLAAGLILVAFGLLCVWLEIGRPWRALNVFRHIRTSWMTREASVALVLFGAGALALFTAHPAALVLAGLCGLAFVYAQARILAADKGIPAWRHPRCAPLVFATGLAEGAGLIAATLAGGLQAVAALVLVSAIAVRLHLWRRYLDGLHTDRAPAASLQAFGAISCRLVNAGHIVPAALALIGLAALLGGLPGAGFAVGAAGLLTVAAGWLFKYYLIRRAAFTQGVTLKHHPVRGGKPASAGISTGLGNA
ncbi:MAG TPA: dimethyl sulfoxide reductase anchor subunit [Azoarcus taiwanensis]|nr:dimethyl sulfoxide reductase anchor subunit [Azoarcus taiwanensis]